ncbi:MAG: hypothetical protein WCF43_11605 [Steroidobacteraceae bacterium]
MKRPVSTPWLVGSAAIATAVTFFVMQAQVRSANERASLLQDSVTESERSLLGYTTYVRYLQEGKKQLAAQQRFLAATVSQPNAVTQVIDQSVLGFHSTGTIAIWYSVEYSFGYDLSADRYDVKSGPDGIVVAVGKPRLVATPAVTNLKYKVLSGGLLTDEAAAALKLYAEASKRAQARGEQLASEPAIMALCEKQLTTFLRTFLLKQPGVTNVPHIAVVYP